MAATVQKGAQQVLITNKSVTVHGSVTAKVTGSVNAAPSAPVQPIQFSAAVAVDNSAKDTPVSAIAYTVPAKKRLVIEYASVDFAEKFDNTETVIASFKTGSGPQFYLPLAYDGTSSAFNLVGSAQVKVYANAGETVSAVATPVNVIEKSQATFSFSGYLVDGP
jgi:hypothetical protein